MIFIFSNIQEGNQSILCSVNSLFWNTKGLLGPIIFTMISTKKLKNDADCRKVLDNEILYSCRKVRQIDLLVPGQGWAEQCLYPPPLPHPHECVFTLTVVGQCLFSSRTSINMPHVVSKIDIGIQNQ